jgi:hypothetical protein
MGNFHRVETSVSEWFLFYTEVLQVFSCLTFQTLGRRSEYNGYMIQDFITKNENTRSLHA